MYREAYGGDDISALNFTVLGTSERRHFPGDFPILNSQFIDCQQVPYLPARVPVFEICYRPHMSHQ